MTLGRSLGSRRGVGRAPAPLPVVAALLLAGLVASLSAGPAAAQFGGMPGLPGGGGAGFPAPGNGPGPGGGGFGAPSGAPPPACQQLFAMRDEVQKHGMAISAANKRHAPVGEACRLFKTFLAAEAKFLKGLKDNQATCNVPSQILAEANAGHENASKAGKQVCDMAAQGAQPPAPSLSDALGSTPTLPDASTTTKSRGSTFDTLTGSPLAR
jgi:hypothetical protein